MSQSDDPIFDLVNGLPGTSITGAVLGALDFAAPGQWRNITDFDELVRDETGETDEALIQQVGQRAIQLYTDPSNSYQKAVWCFQTVDSVDKTIVAASALNLIGQKLNLGFLSRFTPKPETAQAVDAAIKLACELATFRYVNGIPGDSVGEFAKSVGSYAKGDAMRLTAFVALDCVLPLGPNFVDKMSEAISGASLTDNKLFAAVYQYLPGAGAVGQKDVIQKNIQAVGGQLTSLASTRGLDQASVLEKIRQYITFSDDKLDVIAATVDVTTRYYEHTGIQSVARRVISRAYSEI